MITQKKIKIGDNEYTLQMVSADWFIGFMDDCKDDNGKLIQKKFQAGILEHIVVSPHKTIADFTGRINELLTLSKEAQKFVMGEEVDVSTPAEVKNESTPSGEDM